MLEGGNVAMQRGSDNINDALWIEQKPEKFINPQQSDAGTKSNVFGESAQLQYEYAQFLGSENGGYETHTSLILPSVQKESTNQSRARIIILCSSNDVCFSLPDDPHSPRSINTHGILESALVSSEHTRQGNAEQDLWKAICEHPPETRVKAIDILAQLQDPTLLSLFWSALHDEYWEVRAAAAQALGEFRNQQLAPLFIKVFQEETDEIVQQALVRALGKSRNEPTILLLVQILRNPEQDVLVREAAAWALGEFGEKAHIRVLIETLREDPDEIVQAAAAKSLGALRQLYAKKPLLEALRNENKNVGEAATWALQALHQGQWREILWLRRYREADPKQALILLLERQEDYPLHERYQDYEQTLREQTFSLLAHFIRDKRGFISDAILIQEPWSQTLLVLYGYQQTEKALQKEVLPLIEKATAVEPIEKALEIDEYASEVIQQALKVREKRVWHESLLVQLGLFPRAGQPLRVMLFGTAYQKVRDSDPPILEQLSQKWRDHLILPGGQNVRLRPHELRQLRIWYEASPSPPSYKSTEGRRSPVRSPDQEERRDPTRA